MSLFLVVYFFSSKPLNNTKYFRDGFVVDGAVLTVDVELLQQFTYGEWLFFRHFLLFLLQIYLKSKIWGSPVCRRTLTPKYEKINFN